MSIASWFAGVGETGFGFGSTAEDVTQGLDLTGKTYVLTGCNSGLGGETLRVLCLRGARVFGAARSIEKAQAACAAAPGPGEAIALACELSEPASVRAAVETVKQSGHAIDGIIANAGIMALPTLNQRHGFELQFFTNHVGHSILILGLLDQLSDDARIVMVSSGAHNGAPAAGIEFDNLSGERNYAGWSAYGQSKLANLLFARHLATQLPKPGQTANAIHPGVIATNLTRSMNIVLRTVWALAGPLVLKNTAQGAATQVYVATHPDAGKHNGLYWSDCNLKTSSAHGRDDAMAAKLWERTQTILAELP